MARARNLRDRATCAANRKTVRHPDGSPMPCESFATTAGYTSAGLRDLMAQTVPTKCRYCGAQYTSRVNARNHEASCPSRKAWRVIFTRNGREQETYTTRDEARVGAETLIGEATEIVILSPRGTFYHEPAWREWPLVIDAGDESDEA